VSGYRLERILAILGMGGGLLQELEILEELLPSLLLLERALGHRLLLLQRLFLQQLVQVILHMAVPVIDYFFSVSGPDSMSPDTAF
jgi:hypothetical protein